MATAGLLGRRRLLRLVGGAAAAAVASVVGGPAMWALARDYPLRFFKEATDPSDPLHKEHAITIRLPIIAEDGANVPVVVSMEAHPMEPGHYIKSVQVLNFNDPVVSKGLYHLTPANGQAYLSTQIRMDGGDVEVFAICECSVHGKWAASKKLKVSLGGC
jgi:sulfur-oxidizing protein SoxY